MNIHTFLCLLCFSSVFASLTLKSALSKSFSSEFNIIESKKIKPEDVLPDGSYSERVIAQAAHTALNDFNLTASMITENSPATDLALTDAFELVKLTMNIEIEKFKTPVVNQILLSYTKLCISHMIKPDSPEEFKSRRSTAHRTKILVYDCLILNIKIAEKQALKFLEFIYRYADDGYRYQKAFGKLYSRLTNDLIALSMEKFVQHFDPNRQSIPVLVPASSAAMATLLPIFKTFIRNLYEKLISLVDPIEDNEIFFCHASKVITTILSFESNYEDCYDILMTSMPHIDPVALLSSPHFYKSASIAIPQAVRNKSLLLEYFSTFFLTDQVISMIKTREDEIRFGGLIINLKDSNNKFNFLSAESKESLKRFEKKFYKYDELITHSDALKFIQISFLQLSKIYLENLCNNFDELIQNYDLLIKIDSHRITKALSEGSKKIHEIIKMSQNDTKTDFNFYRFKFFLKIMTFLMKNEIFSVQAKAPLLKIIQFYNEKVTELHETDENVLEMIKAKVSKLFKEKKFNPSEEEIKTFYNFFIKFLGVEHGTKEFLEFLSLNLRNTNSIKETFDLIEKVCNELEFPSNLIIVPYLVEEIQNYLKESSKLTSLFNFDSNNLMGLITEVKNSKVLNRSESLILNALSSKYHSFL